MVPGRAARRTDSLKSLGLHTPDPRQAYGRTIQRDSLATRSGGWHEDDVGREVHLYSEGGTSFNNGRLTQFTANLSSPKTRTIYYDVLGRVLR